MGVFSNPVKRLLQHAAAIILLVVLTVYLAFTREDKRLQPIAYSHKAHIETAGLTCTDCHSSVQTSSAASIPRLEICRNCHSDQPVSQSPEEIKLLKYVADGAEIPWVRVYKVPDHVYFSHRRHVTAGRLECKVCHGNVQDFTLPVSSAEVPVTMENCMSCHRKSHVTNDCLSCHR